MLRQHEVMLYVFSAVILAFAAGVFATIGWTQQTATSTVAVRQSADRSVRAIDASSPMMVEIMVYVYDREKDVWDRASEQALAKLTCHNDVRGMIMQR